MAYTIERSTQGSKTGQDEDEATYGQLQEALGLGKRSVGTPAINSAHLKLGDTET